MAAQPSDTGVMQVNGVWVTRVQYEIDAERVGKEYARVQFMRGQQEVAQLKLEKHELAAVLGRGNANEIRKALDAREPDEPKISGVLEGKTLHYKDINTPQQRADAPTLAEPEAEAVNEIRVTRLRAVLQSARETERVVKDDDALAKALDGDKPDAKPTPQASDGKAQPTAAPREQNAAQDASARNAEAERLRAEAAVPAHIASKYIVANDRYHFDEKNVAFVDKGAVLTTKTENVAVIRDLVAIAKERGWAEADVTGSHAFRQQAWKEAYVEGIEVRGYKASALEQAAADAERTRRHGPGAFEKSQDGPTTDKPREPNAADKPPAPVTGAVVNATGNPRDGVVYGKLVEQGQAPYKFDPKNSDSAFVRLDPGDGKVSTYWGVKLSEAVRESQTQVKVGDYVGIQQVASRPVTVTEGRVDAAGQTVTRSIETRRNEWVVEKPEYFQQPDRIAADLDARRARSEGATGKGDGEQVKDLAAKAKERGAGDAVVVSTRVTAADAAQSAGNVSSQGVGAAVGGRQELAARAAAIRAADMTRHELERRYPDLGEAVFKNMDSHQRFADAFVKTGIYRAEDRGQVIAAMNERLAGKVERGEPIQLFDERKAVNLIRASVIRAGADNVRDTTAADRVSEQVRTPKAVVRDDVHVRA